MTIKNDGKNSGTGGGPEIVAPSGGGAGLVEQLEEEINVGIEAEPEIPFATAIPIEPSAPPEKFVTSAASGTSTFAAPVITSGTAPPTSSVQVVMAPATTTPGNHLPPNAPAGGRWVGVQRIGPQTWTICAVVSVVSCFFFCLPCGVWAFCCPCDRERCYEVNGTIYDQDGRCLGSISRNYRYI
jgi:hypothetical protein